MWQSDEPNAGYSRSASQWTSASGASVSVPSSVSKALEGTRQGNALRELMYEYGVNEADVLARVHKVVDTKVPTSGGSFTVPGLSEPLVQAPATYQQSSPVSAATMRMYDEQNAAFDATRGTSQWNETGSSAWFEEENTESHLYPSVLPASMSLDLASVGAAPLPVLTHADDTPFYAETDPEELDALRPLDNDGDEGGSFVHSFLSSVPAAAKARPMAVPEVAVPASPAQEDPPGGIASAFNQSMYQEFLFQTYKKEMKLRGIKVHASISKKPPDIFKTAPRKVLVARQHNPIGTGVVWDPFYDLEWWEKGKDPRWVIQHTNCSSGPIHADSGVRLFIDVLGNMTFGPYACHPLRIWVVEYFVEKGVKRGEPSLAQGIDRFVVENLKDPIAAEEKVLDLFGPPKNAFPPSSRYIIEYPPESGMKFTPTNYGADEWNRKEKLRREKDKKRRGKEKGSSEEDMRGEDERRVGLQPSKRRDSPISGADTPRREIEEVDEGRRAPIPPSVSPIPTPVSDAPRDKKDVKPPQGTQETKAPQKVLPSKPPQKPKSPSGAQTAKEPQAPSPAANSQPRSTPEPNPSQDASSAQAPHATASPQPQPTMEAKPSQDGTTDPPAGNP